MRLALVCLVFILVIPAVTAYDGIFSILDETAYNDALDIVTEYEPNKTVQSSEHIRGWIDIDRSQDTVIINGVTYINNSDSSTPEVLYEVWDEGLYWNNNLDWIIVTDERITTHGNITTAEIDIKLKWHRSTKRSRTITTPFGSRTITWISKDYYYETATFSKTVYSSVYSGNEDKEFINTIDSPVEYPKLEISRPTITIYNNSLNPHIKICVPIQQFETKTTFSYDDENITRVNMMGLAATGGVNFSDCLYWEDESDLFATKNDIAILKMNALEFNPNKLQITVYSPYESIITDNYTISTVEYDQGERIKESGVILPLLILILFGYGIKKCMKIWSEIV